MLIFHIDFNFVSLKYDFVKELLRKIASMNYDAVLWELEDQIIWDCCPECAHSDSWSKSKFKELLAYSRDLGLEPIPLLQTIGHAEYVMKHKLYYNFREHPDYSDCYCVSNPEVRCFLKKWINEYCELFGELKYFHLGGDEAYRFGTCEKCSKRKVNDLYGEYINFLAKDLLEKNIRPGIWGDMILAHPEELKSISHDFIIWDWNYTAGYNIPETVRVWGKCTLKKDKIDAETLKQFPELIDYQGNLNPFYTVDFLKRNGYDVIVCSAARSASDGFFCPNIAIHAENIIGTALKYNDSELMGHCVTSWAIRLNSIMLETPLLELAYSVNSNPQASHETILKQTALKYFGFSNGFDIADKLSSCDNRLRIFSAVQWSGLKDSVPSPPDYITNWIKVWESENEVFWKNKNDMFDSIERTIQDALVYLQREVENELTRTWKHAAELSLKYLNLLKIIFDQDYSTEAIKIKIYKQKPELVNYFSSEQTTTSAIKNTDLILSPLLDYLKFRQQ